MGGKTGAGLLVLVGLAIVLRPQFVAQTFKEPQGLILQRA